MKKIYHFKLNKYLLIEKYNKLKRLHTVNKKHYRLMFVSGFIGLILFFSLLLTFHLIHEVKAKDFFERYSEDVMIWKLTEDDFISALRKNFKGKRVSPKIYTITPGDHYWKIANEHSINIDTILGCNPHIRGLYARVGEQIVAINTNGILHYVQDNEDISILAEFYNVEESVISSYNRLGIFNRIKKGDVLFIPGARPKVFTPDLYEAVKRRRMFAVPTNGWVAGRGFGYKMHPILKKMMFHKGIDMKCGEGTPIFASAAGEVIYSGSAGTYGKLIKIKHTNGFETRYAHCSRLYVKIGQKVEKKQCIGRVGATGRATCAHLHFEIRKNDKPIDPMKYLW